MVCIKSCREKYNIGLNSIFIFFVMLVRENCDVI